MKERIRGNKAVMAVSLAAASVMPLYVLAMFMYIWITGDIFNPVINQYDLLFCGFYGSVFLCLSWDKEWFWLKVLFTVINTLINGFYILMAFMGGTAGPLLALAQMLIPVRWYRFF